MKNELEKPPRAFLALKNMLRITTFEYNNLLLRRVRSWGASFLLMSNKSSTLRIIKKKLCHLKVSKYTLSSLHHKYV